MQELTYARPSTVEEAIGLLQNGGNARVLAGGTDVIVIARSRRQDIGTLVDIKHIPDLTGISYSAADGLTIGAATPLYQIYGHADVREHYPCIIDSAILIGGTGIQGRASLGGNLCNSSPSGDSIPTQIVLNGSANIVGPNGARTVAAQDFCTGPGQNVLQPGEFVVSLRFPAPAPHSGARFLRFIPRNEMDIAVVNAATALELDGDIVTAARIAIGAAAPTVVLSEASAAAIVGRPLTDETLEEAARASSEAVSPIDDMRGTIKQRRHLAGVLTKRTIEDAAARARGEQVGH